MLVRRLARPMLASYFLVEGVGRLRQPKEAAAEAAPFVEMAAEQTGIPNDPELVVRASGAAQVTGGALLALGKFPRPASALLAATLAPSTYVHEAFWSETDPEVKARKKSAFLRNVAILGGLILASVDTAGKPGLGWRAGHGAQETRRGALRAARSAKREAKLLATQAENSLS